MSKPRELTEPQKLFLEALFGPAKGDPEVAKKIAGYSENTPTHQIMKSLRDEIISGAKDILASSAPKMAFALIDVATNPNQSSATTKMKAAESILNRVGVSESKGEDVNLKVPSGGLFILPAKEKRPSEIEAFEAQEEEVKDE